MSLRWSFVRLELPGSFRFWFLRCNVRPHPGLLPQEKVNHSPSSFQFTASGVRTTSTQMLANRPQTCPLLGERKQVRASVKHQFHFPSNLHTRNASVTPQACASQPRWVCGASPSRISGTWPRQPVFINCSMLPRYAFAAVTASGDPASRDHARASASQKTGNVHVHAVPL